MRRRCCQFSAHVQRNVKLRVAVMAAWSPYGTVVMSSQILKQAEFDTPLGEAYISVCLGGSSD